jgi:hypothetical protein
VLCVWVEERVEESVYGVCLGRRAFTVYFLVVLYNCKKYVWVNIVTLKALEVLKYYSAKSTKVLIVLKY